MSQNRTPAEKEAWNAYQREWRRNHPEATALAGQTWRAKNPGRMAEIKDAAIGRNTCSMCAERPVANRAGYCKQCQKARNSTPAAKHVQRVAALRSYGITPGRYEEMLEAQGDVCAICSQAETRKDPRTGGTHRLSVDHDHACCPSQTAACGRCVRGLICHRCNYGIGYFGDVPSRLRAAAAYLEAFTAQRAAITQDTPE